MKLNDSIDSLKGIGPKKAAKFHEAGIFTLEDLLSFFPRKYEDRRNVTPIANLEPGKDGMVCAKVLAKRFSGNPYNKKSVLSVTVQDDSGTMEIVFFNGRFLSNAISAGKEYTFFGKVSEKFGKIQMAHPEFCEKGSSADIRGVIPIYPQIKGISQTEIRRIQKSLKPLYEELKEWLPDDVVEENRLADPSYSIENIHFPKNGRSVLEGKYRLIFDELLTLETGLCYIRNDCRKDVNGIVMDTSGENVFLEKLPFELTEGQKSAWEDIKKDLQSEKVMNRLIQGDVGSGKTVIAELAMFVSAVNGYQSVIMAPTEILAKQHLESLKQVFEPFDISVGLLCSSMKKKEKEDVLSDLEEGKIQILTGTHAVIQPNVKFKNLGMVVTDEQHRFGVRQRQLLSKKGENTNVIVMTATPIPRTLAVILYGDLDVSQIRTMPKGRIPIKTVVENGDSRNRVYDFVKQELAKKRQAYVVAPLIEDSETIEAKSAEELYEELKDKFRAYTVALIHGNLKQEEKDAIMEDFAGGKIDVLVSTVVIEVGINVPNATVMVIENSERFGLAQMHQLRGRVGRGSDQSYCFLICYSDGKVAKERNQIMASTTDGFKIAEEDLKLRGPGEMFGTRQHGLPELYISDLIRHIDVLEKTKDIAKEIIDKDPEISDPKLAPLKNKIKKMFGDEIRLEL